MSKPKIAPGDTAREEEYRLRRKAVQDNFRERNAERIRAAYAANKEEIQAKRRANRAADPEKYRAYERSRKRVITPAQRERINAAARDKWATDAAHREKRLAKTVVWRENNKEQDYARDRKYRTENASKVEEWRQTSKSRKLHRKWYAENPEKMKERSRNFYWKDPLVGRAVAKKWRLAHPEAARVLDSNSRARRKGAEGKHTKEDIARLYTEQNGVCVYCTTVLGSKFHKDHIMPLAKGGSNWPNNIQLLCAPCNMQKHDMHPELFAKKKATTKK